LKNSELVMETKERLASLDVLRGIDLFFLVGLEGVMHTLSTAIDTEGLEYLMPYTEFASLYPPPYQEYMPRINMK
jgi:hypothetical protein